MVLKEEPATNEKEGFSERGRPPTSNQQQSTSQSSSSSTSSSSSNSLAQAAQASASGDADRNSNLHSNATSGSATIASSATSSSFQSSPSSSSSSSSTKSTTSSPIASTAIGPSTSKTSPAAVLAPSAPLICPIDTTSKLSIRNQNNPFIDDKKEENETTLKFDRQMSNYETTNRTPEIAQRPPDFNREKFSSSNKHKNHDKPFDERQSDKVEHLAPSKVQNSINNPNPSPASGTIEQSESDGQQQRQPQQPQQQHQRRPSVVLLGNELLQLAQRSSQAAAPSARILRRSIVGKSSELLHSLRRHYTSFTASSSTTSSTTIGVESDYDNEDQHQDHENDQQNQNQNQNKHQNENQLKQQHQQSESQQSKSESLEAKQLQSQNKLKIFPASDAASGTKNQHQNHQPSRNLERAPEVDSGEAPLGISDSCLSFYSLASHSSTATVSQYSAISGTPPNSPGDFEAPKKQEKQQIQQKRAAKSINQQQQQDVVGVRDCKNEINGTDNQKETISKKEVIEHQVSENEIKIPSNNNPKKNSVLKDEEKQEVKVKEKEDEEEQRQLSKREEGVRNEPEVKQQQQQEVEHHQKMQKQQKSQSSSRSNSSQNIVMKPPVPPPPSNLSQSAKKQLLQKQQQQSNSSTGSGQHQSSGAAAESSSSSSPPPPPQPPITPTQSQPVVISSQPTSQQQQQSFRTSSPIGARRHALLAQSFERDALLSLKTRDMKHKRGSSIRSALKGANFSAIKLGFDRRPRHQQLDQHGNSGATMTSSYQQFKDKQAASNDLIGAGVGETTSAKGGVAAAVFGNRKQKSSKPYELFEPPITQRSVQRSKRRGAMMSTDPRRQMSADTIGLRQLTDEYLANAGVLAKPAMSSSGQCSLVALTAPTATGQPPSAAATAVSPAGAGSVGIYGTQPQYSLLEAQLYQASRNHQQQQQSAMSMSNQHVQPHHNRAGTFRTALTMIETSSLQNRARSDSEDSMGFAWALGCGISGAASVATAGAQSSAKSQTGSAGSIQQQQQASDVVDATTIFNMQENNHNNICTSLPGSLPWQSDVSIQCELFPAPPLVEPYETTGDILSTIARPYPAGAISRSPSRNRLKDGQTESLDTSGGHHHHHLSTALLRKGLTAISQHHLAPAGLSAQEVASNVVGSLKKSLSNTLDVANRTSHTPSCLYSQDSLPAYSSLNNEPDDRDEVSTGANSSSKLARQSSTKLMVNTAVAAVGKKVGLQRALSFDCRGGYKRGTRADSSNQHQDSADSAGSNSTTTSGTNKNSNALLAISNNQSSSTHHKSTQSMTTGGGQSHSHASHSSDKDNQYLPRPYLPQSASQVDFQVPLLPYDRMQEALVSNRMLGGSGSNSGVGGGGGSHPSPPSNTSTGQATSVTTPTSSIKPQMFVPGELLLSSSSSSSSSTSSSNKLVQHQSNADMANNSIGIAASGSNFKQKQSNQHQHINLDKLICMQSPRGTTGDTITSINENTDNNINNNAKDTSPLEPFQLDGAARHRSAAVKTGAAAMMSPTISLGSGHQQQQLSKMDAAAGPVSTASQISRRQSPPKVVVGGQGGTNLSGSSQDNQANVAKIGAVQTFIAQPSQQQSSSATKTATTTSGDPLSQSTRAGSNQDSSSSSPSSSSSSSAIYRRAIQPSKVISNQSTPIVSYNDNEDDNNNEAFSINSHAHSRSYVVDNVQVSDDIYQKGRQQQQDSLVAGSFNLLVPGQIGAGSTIPNSPSFSISPDGKTSSLDSSGQLTASEIFSGSNQLVKRPSTMLAGDVMTQFAQALSSSGSGAASQHQQQQHQHQVGSVGGGRYRRQAIVPPKLSTDPDDHYLVDDHDDATDYHRSGQQPTVGRLIDISSESRNSDLISANVDSQTRRASADELTYANARRKRSGGDPIGHRDKHTKNNQQAPVVVVVPSFTIDDADENQQRQQHQTVDVNNHQEHHHHEKHVSMTTTRPNSVTGSPTQRPDSQLTNHDSFVSSTSSLCKRELTSPGSLTVAFDNFRDRRRSSIAIIPQMQICPGDLLVYSKQLIERMNQSDDQSTETPEFLTIDGKKGKNIWSSFKLFDNRSIKARHEYLCNLDEVLNTLQPSTFVDEQLSHYKGMLWNEFLMETESRRSASSEALAAIHLQDDDDDDDDTNNHRFEDLRLTDDEMLTSGAGNRHGSTGSQCEISPVNQDSGEERKISTSGDHETVSKLNNSSSAETPTRSTSGEPVNRMSNNSRSGSIKMLAGWSIGRGNRGSIKGSSTPGGNNGATGAQGNAQSTTNNQAPSSGTTPKNSSSSTSDQQQKTTSPIRNNKDQQPAGDQASPLKPLGRFKEKPKLRRGQTVDSVFRIPLVPSSPLKHALHHQQTPTAHLENQDHLITTIEDDYERSPTNSRNPAESDNGADKKQITNIPSICTAEISTNNNDSSLANHHSSSKKKGRSSFRSSMQGPLPTEFETSFDLDSSETLDIASGRSSSGLINHHHHHHQHNSHPNHSHLLYQQSQRRQFMRQSSLSTLSSTVTRTEQKRQRALWDLFQSECTFFFDHLMTLKNVYMEPLKKIQVEGFAMQADPDVLFGNLDELCCGVYDFCKEFLQIIIRTLKHQPEELNATDVLIKLYKRNPKIEHLRGIYHRYTLNYINALTYLDTLRRQVEFVEFEKWSSRDSRCKKLQLTDLLVAPVQHIMRVPIILKDIESHTEDMEDKKEIRAILAVEEASLRELDDKMRWLKNFERLLEIQKNIIWPSVIDLEPKVFVPEFLRDVLSKQPCEKLIVSPRRQIVHEGTLANFDTGKPCDMHVILFDDMLLFTRRKKGLTKRTSTVCRTNPSGSGPKDDGAFKYIVYKHPLSLDRIYVHDVPPADSQAMGIKNVILIVVLNRFQQITTLHWFSAPNEDLKQTWQYKMKKTMDRWKKLGNDADGRRSETLAAGGVGACHYMTLQEQIQQSMDAEASQVPVELLHNWIDRRNRNQRSHGSNAGGATSTNNRSQPQHQHHPNSGGATSRRPIMEFERGTNANQMQGNNNQLNWRQSSDLESRAGGAATTTTTLTATTTKSQSQILPTQNQDCGGDDQLHQHQQLVSFRSNPNSPDRSQSQSRNDFSLANRNSHHQHHQSLYQTSNDTLRSTDFAQIGNQIELRVTNASVKSDENLTYNYTPNQIDTNLNDTSKPPS